MRTITIREGGRPARAGVYRANRGYLLRRQRNGEYAVVGRGNRIY